MRRLYFDHNATTPIDTSVLDAMLPFLREEYGNASSIHHFGQRARAGVERARAQVAELIGCQPREIVLTSGGTEADDLAILGIVRASRKAQKHVITSAIEHHAVIHSCRALEREGVSVTYLPVTADGFVEPAAVRNALRPETVLITVHHGNNEIGTIQPLAEIARIGKEVGVLVHTDAVQSCGKVPVSVRQLGVDLLTLSAHKFYGPKGAGALYVREDLTIEPILFGGHDEKEPRPGTENVPAIVGLGAAAELAGKNMSREASRLRALRDRLESGILSRIADTGLNGPAVHGEESTSVRVPNTTNAYFDFIEGEALVVALDLQGMACSVGSACSAGAVEPSHVLTAIGRSDDRARSSLRLSLGKQNTEEQVDILLQELVGAVERLRALSPRSSQQAAVATR